MKLYHDYLETNNNFNVINNILQLWSIKVVYKNDRKNFSNFYRMHEIFTQQANEYGIKLQRLQWTDSKIVYQKN